MPKIKIDKENMDMKEGGWGEYKFKVKGNPGKHVIDVQIVYKDQLGKVSTLTDYIEYTIDK